MDDHDAGRCFPANLLLVNNIHLDLPPQACNRMSSPCVPLYDSLGENAIEFIINHAEASVAFVATEKLPNLVKALPKTKEVLKTVVYWGEGNKAAIEVGTRAFCLFDSF